MVRASGGGPGFLIFVPPRGLTWVPAPSSPHTFVNVLLLQTRSWSKEPVLGPLARHSFGHMLQPHWNLTFLGSVISARMESFLGQYGLWQEPSRCSSRVSQSSFVPSVLWACYPQSTGCGVCLPMLSALIATNWLTRDWFDMGSITGNIVTSEYV